MARARRLALVALVGLAVAQTPTPRPTPAPTTARPTTAAPSTARPTTPQPTTAKPTTAAPSTAQPTTAAPTTARPTTAAPTEAPSQLPTHAPTGVPTPRPTTAVPTTAAPTLYCRVADLEAQPRCVRQLLRRRDIWSPLSERPAALSERREYQRVREQQQAEGHFTRGCSTQACAQQNLGRETKAVGDSIFAFRKPAALRKKRSSAWSTGP